MEWSRQVQQKIDTVEMLVEHELARRGLRLRFPTELEAQFETDTGPGRCRMVLIQAIFALAIYLLYGLSDFWVIPDVAMMATMLRVGVVGSLTVIFVAVMLWSNPTPLVRESMIAGCCTFGGLTTLGVMVMSESPLRDLRADSTILVMLFIAVVQRARFPFTLGSCVVLSIAQVAALQSLPDFPLERLLNSTIIFTSATLLIAMASFTLEREFRRSYLMRLREQFANSTLSDIAQHDALTGLENRRALDLAFAAVASNGHRGDDIAVVLLDIDHFKAYNDALGHPAGDDALRQVANALHKGRRTSADRVFRYGGEEFLLFLPQTPLDEAVALAERLRRRIEALDIPHPKTTKRVVSASFGVASTRISDQTGTVKLVASADKALYAAKRNGRNQVWPPLLRGVCAVPKVSSER